MAAKILTIDDISAIIDVKPRTIRKILRANVPAEKHPGKGKRWTFRETDIEKVRAMIESASANSDPIDLD